MTRKTHIKICGIDTVANALLAADAGADALGLVFAEQSARCLEPVQAAKIAAAVEGKTCRVGMFVDPQAQQVRQILDTVELDVLQFHGNEPASFCRQFSRPYIKAFRAESCAASAIREQYPDAWGWLLDAVSGDRFGGTGTAFDLSLWPKGEAGRWLLAGGLTPETVAAAIVAVRPPWVDVSSGVETKLRGQKDPERISAFVQAVAAADAGVAAAAAQR